MSLTLDQVREIAVTYVPSASADPDLLRSPYCGPAHEIGHLLMAAPRRVGKPEFGLTRETRAALVEEYAVNVVQTWILAASVEWKHRLSERRLRELFAGPTLDRTRFDLAVTAQSLTFAVRGVWRELRREHHLTYRTCLRHARRLIDKRGITRDDVQTSDRLVAACRTALSRAGVQP